MAPLLDLLLLFAAAVICGPMAFFCLEVAAALWPARRRETRGAEGHAAAPRLAVLIPAHNEERGIGRTLASLLPTLPPGARVLVVADNCSDGTADAARAAGAEVAVRTDAERRGKGYALDFGLDCLAADPPAAVVFLDADCQVEPHTAERLAQEAISANAPVQGLNLCDPAPGGPPLSAVSAFAFRFKNLVRMLGLTRLGGPAVLTGTGMAIPWTLLSRVQFANGNLVEDMQLGIDFTLAGHPPRFVPEAGIRSPLPATRAAARTQRTRWEQGHLRTILSQAPRLAWLAVRRGNPRLALAALDLATPPLSLLAAVWLAAVVAALAIGALGGLWLAAVALGVAGAAFVAAILAGWLAHCRSVIHWQALCAAPLYAAAKLPIYAAFFFRRGEQRWVRTER